MAAGLLHETVPPPSAGFCRYITFSFITLAEMVAQLSTFFVADKAGRHVIITVGLVLSGTACLACAMTENGNARAVLAVIGKFGCTGGR